MSYFDDASLVMIPSGYKTSKVYSVKPTDGTGDLTFTRSLDTATRVGPDGLIEKVRTNLLTYSQDFTSAAGWSVIGGSVATTANFGVAPDGTTTSTRLVFSGASEIWAKSVSGATGIGVFSLFIKGTAGETILITYGGIADKTITLGAGWNRFNTDGNAAISTQMFINTYGGATARDIEVWGGQVELGDIATPYIPTTTAAVSVGMLANVPRLDYTGGGCPKLILEPQRVNLLHFSEQIDNAFWSKSNATISVNAVTSPDGFTNADNVVENTSAGAHGVGNLTGLTLTAVPHTFSVFVKKQTRTFFNISTFDGSTTLDGYFNLTTGAVGIMPAGMTGTITDYGNDWYRCTATRTMGANSNNFFGFNAAISNGTTSYTGTGAIAISLYGCSLEVGSYATSYIPTLGAAVTRGADAASKTGISSLIGQTEGTIFVDYTCDNSTASAFSRAIAISDGTGDNRIIFNDNVGVMSFFASKAGVTQANAATAVSFFGSHKVAIAYANNDFKVYVDGVAVLTDTSFDVPACNALYVATYEEGSPNQSNNKINQALLFKTRLTNAQLAELTA